MEIPKKLNVSGPISVVPNPEIKGKKFNKEEAVEIAKLLNVDFEKICMEEFLMGLNVELEHGTKFKETNITFDDPIMTGKIALAHLNEKGDYYSKLKIMEGKK